VVEKAPGLRRDNHAEQVYKENAPQLSRIQKKGRRGQIEVCVSETSHKRKEHCRAHSKIRQQPWIARVLLRMIKNLLQMWRRNELLRQR